MHIVDTGMADLYPNVGRALTLPVSSCSCERSFSAFKFCKNALWGVPCYSPFWVILWFRLFKLKKMQFPDLKAIAEIVWNSVQRRYTYTETTISPVLMILVTLRSH